ncbi:MAG: SHOCT domain-containing protein, partial [Oxalobacter sp.]
NVISVNVPEDNPGYQKLQQALAKKTEMEIIGFNYQQERSFDVMQTAAGNEGSAGGMMGAGMGMGMGMGMGIPMGNMMGNMAGQMSMGNQQQMVQQMPQQQPVGQQMGQMPQQQTAPAAGVNYQDKIQILKELAELKAQGILTEEEFAAQKKQILG